MTGSLALDPVLASETGEPTEMLHLTEARGLLAEAVAIRNRYEPANEEELAPIGGVMVMILAEMDDPELAAAAAREAADYASEALPVCHSAVWLALRSGEADIAADLADVADWLADPRRLPPSLRLLERQLALLTAQLERVEHARRYSEVAIGLGIDLVATPPRQIDAGR
jgi:hypothetical protein